MTTYVDALKYVIKSKGYDDYLESSLRKMLEYERHSIIENLETVEKDIKDYEEEYSMSSKEFIERFNKGILGDKTDFIEWFALTDTKNRLDRTLKKLEALH